MSKILQQCGEQIAKDFSAM